MCTPHTAEPAGTKPAPEQHLPPSEIPWGEVFEQVSAIVQSFLRLVALETKDALTATTLAPILIIVKYSLFVIIWFSFSVWISVVVYDLLNGSGSAAAFTFLALQLFALAAVEWRLRRLRQTMRFPYTKACLAALRKEMNV